MVITLVCIQLFHNALFKAHHQFNLLFFALKTKIVGLLLKVGKIIMLQISTLL